jgi:glucoamylase
VSVVREGTLPQQRKPRNGVAGVVRPGSKRRRGIWVVATLVVVLSMVAGGAMASETMSRTGLPLLPDGVAADLDGSVLPIAVGANARFIPGTSFLVDSGASAAAVAESRAWLASGLVPGSTARERELAERSLLDIRLLTDRHGATVAGWRTAWRYVWPRDAAFVVAAFAATGHLDEAARVLDYLAQVATHTGLWQARYLPDGSGLAPDCRVMQFDGAGWVPWAVWSWYVTATASSATSGVTPDLRPYWPMVRASANAIVKDMGKDGLPSPSSDYIEHPEPDLTLGAAAPLLVGLRSAADLARRADRTVDAARWEAAAQLLDAAITANFGPVGYQRRFTGAGPNQQWQMGDNGYPQRPRDRGDADSAVTFLMPPFAPPTPERIAAMVATRRTLTLPSGGIKPVEQWRSDGAAWTPETALFALAAAGLGDKVTARRLIDWIAAHRTSSGAIPEQVSRDGEPLSVAPLAWTQAIVLLGLVQLDRGLPMPPVVGPVVRAPERLVEPQDSQPEPDDRRHCRR